MILESCAKGIFEATKKIKRKIEKNKKIKRRRKEEATKTGSRGEGEKSLYDFSYLHLSSGKKSGEFFV